MKLLHLLLLLLILSCTPPTDAQTSEDEEAGFAFVENAKGKNGSISFLKKESYKKTYQYKIAKEVYDRLVDARGDFRMRVPKFVMSDAERQVASAKPRSAVITLEMKAYEVCQSLGKDSINALAALLSHELTHYYEKHNWTNHFANNHRHSRTGMKLGNLNEGLRLETQADYLGGFLAYSAGYKSLDVMPRLLEAVYDQYKLPENIKGYPSLEERTDFATKSADKLKDLVVVFETAKYLTAVEMYEQAKLYYEYILKDFQSRELYNNLGVVATLAAMKYMNNDDLKFGYPLELDAESRLGEGTKGGHGFGVAEELLNQAVDYFNQANQMDKEYPISVLNLACAYTFQSKFDEDKLEDAKFYARKAQKLCKDKKWAKTGTSVLVLQGIIAEKEGDKEAAATFFKKAERAGNSLAGANLKILNDEPFGEGMAMGFATIERIKGININTVPAYKERQKLEIEKQFKIKKSFCEYLTDEQSALYIYYESEDKNAFFQIAKADYKGTTSKGIRYGDHYNKVIEKHGNPSRSLELGSGRILVYFPSNILFELDDQSNVSRIGVYRYEMPSILDDD